MSQDFDTQISVSPAQFYFILKYSQIKFKAFTQGGKKNAAISDTPFYITFVIINYTVKQRKKQIL